MYACVVTVIIMSVNRPNEIPTTKESLASHYALHVALQTMKERCLGLQQRLSVVEEENVMLRTKSGTMSPFDQPNNGQSEVEMLREKVKELSRQKLQLTEHIGMVAAENRQLWSRLSKLTKDNQSLGTSLDKIKDTLVNTGHQNLIRSKTFTQSSPNPILRQKFHDASGVSKELENNSLEEIPLVDGNTDGRSDEMYPGKAVNSLGFGYLNDDSMHIDMLHDTRRCLDNLGEIKKELLRQQSDLKVALSGLRQKRGKSTRINLLRLNEIESTILFCFCCIPVLEMCSSCKNNATKSKVDKNFGTTDENDSARATTDLSGYDKDDDAAYATFMPIKPEHTNAIDILEQKRIADCLDKMCPMCGKVYSSQTTFELFQDHVESHFLDDSELDASIDKNFEIISSSVGNF